MRSFIVVVVFICVHVEKKNLEHSLDLYKIKEITVKTNMDHIEKCFSGFIPSKPVCQNALSYTKWYWFNPSNNPSKYIYQNAHAHTHTHTHTNLLCAKAASFILIFQFALATELSTTLIKP